MSVGVARRVKCDLLYIRQGFRGREEAGYHRCVSLISAITWPALCSACGQKQRSDDANNGWRSRRTRSKAKEEAAGRHLEHVGGLLAPLGHVLGLGQQVGEQARSVELAHQLALEAVLDVVDQEVHDGLGHTGGEKTSRPPRRTKKRGAVVSAMRQQARPAGPATPTARLPARQPWALSAVRNQADGPGLGGRGY